MDSDAAYRWTLDEYVLRVELAGSGLREVIVEGSTDRAFIEGALDRYDLTDVVVFDATYFEVSDDEVVSAGFASGVKGSLLTLGGRLAGSADYVANEALVVVVVDRDLDGVPPVDLSACVLATDYYSMESYAFTERSLNRFVRQVLVREVRPAGAGGDRRTGRHSCSGAELLERVFTAGTVIGAVRLVLRTAEPPVGVIVHWDDYFAVATDGSLTTRGDDLLRVCLESAGERPAQFQDRLDASLADAREAPRMLVRGRDLVRILLKVLRSPWGRRVSSTNFARVEEPTLTTWLLGAAHPGELDAEPLFISLRERFALTYIYVLEPPVPGLALPHPSLRRHVRARHTAAPRVRTT